MQVRNESADDFLLLLREWRQLCASCSLLRNNTPTHPFLKVRDEDEEDNNDNGDEDEGSGDDEQGEIFEVEELLEICYGDPKEKNKPGLYFKVFIHHVGTLCILTWLLYRELFVYIL